jgi:hypothetical protein
MALKDQNGDLPRPLNSLWTNEEKSDTRLVMMKGSKAFKIVERSKSHLIRPFSPQSDTLRESHDRNLLYTYFNRKRRLHINPQHLEIPTLIKEKRKRKITHTASIKKLV